jgi:hypothetical protein
MSVLLEKVTPVRGAENALRPIRIFGRKQPEFNGLSGYHDRIRFETK